MVNRMNLTEIKKGQEGCGLLIEQDGYISLSDEKNRVLRESIESYTNGECPSKTVCSICRIPKVWN